MKEITNISNQLKGERVNLFLDDKFFCGLNKETAIKNKLKIGDLIDENKLCEMVEADEVQTAFNKCLKLLNKRFKTEFEIKKYLSEKDFLENVILKTVDKLKEYKYINDEQYAESFVNYNKNFMGKQKLKQKLMEKKVEISIVEKMLQNVENQEKLIDKYIEKYLKNREHNLKTKKNLYNFLLQKGFSYEEILSKINMIEFKN